MRKTPPAKPVAEKAPAKTIEKPTRAPKTAAQKTVGAGPRVCPSAPRAALGKSGRPQEKEGRPQGAAPTPSTAAGDGGRSKTIPVKAAAPAPPQPVRVIVETTGASGRAWRMSSRYAVAYVKDAALAGELLATEPRHLAKAAMAVYYDRKGKAFAWQVRFDADRWDEVVGRLG